MTLLLLSLAATAILLAGYAVGYVAGAEKGTQSVSEPLPGDFPEIMVGDQLMWERSIIDGGKLYDWDTDE